jgi:hypothetical protein
MLHKTQYISLEVDRTEVVNNSVDIRIIEQFTVVVMFLRLDKGETIKSIQGIIKTEGMIKIYRKDKIKDIIKMITEDTFKVSKKKSISISEEETVEAKTLMNKEHLLRSNKTTNVNWLNKIYLNPNK